MTNSRGSIIIWPLLVLLLLAPLPAQAGGLTFLESLPFDRDLIEPQGLEDALAVAVRSDGQYVYAVGRHGLSRWERDPSTGRLTFKQAWLNDMSDTYGIDGGNAVALATATSGDTHVYVAGRQSDAVGVFTSAAVGGALSFVEKKADSGFNIMRGPTGIAVSGDGAHVYVTAGQDQTVVVFSRDAASGSLTYLASYASTHDIGAFEGLDHPQGIALSPDGKSVYVSAARSLPLGVVQGTIVVFRRDDDALSPTFGELAYQSLVRDHQGIPEVQHLDDPHALVVSPDGKDLYVASFGGNALLVFSRDDVDPISSSYGDLTYLESWVDGGVVKGLNNAYGVAISPDGQYVFVGGRIERALNVFLRDNDLLSPTLGRVSFVESQTSPENKKAPKYPFHCNGGTNDGAQCDYPSACPGGTCSGDTLHGLVGPGSPAVTSDNKSLYITGAFPGSLLTFSIDVCGNNNRGVDEQCDDGGPFCDSSCKLTLCGSAPTTGCGTIHTTSTGNASLSIKNDATELDTKDSMSWQWKKGNVPIADFGNPLTTASYVVCVYDDSANTQPLASRAIPKGGPEWTQKIDAATMLPKQFKYKSKPLRPEGIAAMTLTAGAPDKASIKIKGKGGFLRPPTLAPAVPGPAGLDVPVTVVVRNTETTDCWVATYDGIVGVDPKLISKNDEAQFKGKSQ